MTVDTSNETTATDADLAEEDTTPVPTEFASKEEFEKGTWQHTVQQSSVLFKRSGDAKKRASVLLWQGATSAIAEWESDSDSDVNGEGLAADLLLIMGTSRKGDVSKIKTVALAVRNNGLETGSWPNLSKAYAEAIRLTKTAKAEAEEDTAGDEAVAKIEAPEKADTAESAVRMALALAGDFDEFCKVTLDVINQGGDENLAAHRALLRALSNEVGGRAKPAPAPAPAAASGDKAGATAATTTEAETATKAPAKAKGKRSASVPTETGAPTQAGNGTTKPRPTPAQAEAPVEADAEGDIFAEADAEAETPAPAKKTSTPRPRRA